MSWVVHLKERNYMGKSLIFTAWLLVVWLACAGALNGSSSPLLGLEKLKDFEAMRASSSDPDWRNGNRDAKSIEPGGTLTLAELEGPGTINHIWCTISHPAQFYSRLLTLRIYWDGETHPSVECPIGDFFGIGHGLDRPFVSIPIKVSSEGRARNCYWPMPFRKSARITVTNESDQPCRAFYYYIDWQKSRTMPRDVAYFHAMYRQEFPCNMGRNYLVADITGRGHYVGTIQSVCATSSLWYGEGDDFFFIDGEKEPRLRGTGTEDYFCDAWGFRQQDGPFYGTPLWEGRNAGDRTTAYRFHISDPIPFRKSLRVEIEHKGQQLFPDGTRTVFIERDDLMSSVAFWYQVEPHKQWPPLPPGPERLPFLEETLVRGAAAANQARHSGQPVQLLESKGLIPPVRQLLYAPTEQKAWIEFSFKVGKDQEMELYGKMLHGPNHGKYRVTLDGDELEVADLYDPVFGPMPHRWGVHRLLAGTHTLRFECAGKAPASQGYFLGFDALVGRTPVRIHPADFDLRKIQAQE